MERLGKADANTCGPPQETKQQKGNPSRLDGSQGQGESRAHDHQHEQPGKYQEEIAEVQEAVRNEGLSEGGEDADGNGQTCGECGGGDGAREAKQQGSSEAEGAVPAEFVRSGPVLTRRWRGDVVSILRDRTCRRAPRQ